jgi:hypothetical protein
MRLRHPGRFRKIWTPKIAARYDGVVFGTLIWSPQAISPPARPFSAGIF